jgi:hypothetical protein
LEFQVACPLFVKADRSSLPGRRVPWCPRARSTGRGRCGGRRVDLRRHGQSNRVRCVSLGIHAHALACACLRKRRKNRVFHAVHVCVCVCVCVCVRVVQVNLCRGDDVGTATSCCLCSCELHVNAASVVIACVGVLLLFLSCCLERWKSVSCAQHCKFALTCHGFTALSLCQLQWTTWHIPRSPFLLCHD